MSVFRSAGVGWELSNDQTFRKSLTSRRACLSAGQPGGCGCRRRDVRFRVELGRTQLGGLAMLEGLCLPVPCLNRGDADEGDTVTE